MPNDKQNKLRLGDSTEINENLKPLKVGGVNSPLEISKTELNVRGTVNVQDIYVNGVAVITESTDIDSLNDLSDVTYSSGDLTISSLDAIIASTLIFVVDDGEVSAFKIKGNAAGQVSAFTVGMEDDNFTELRMNEAGGASTSDYFSIHTQAAGVTTIATTDDGGATGHLTLDVDGDLTLDSHTGAFIVKAAGTEFSAANSAYAGMLLGFTVDGNDSADQTYNLTTSYVVFDSDLAVTFKTPPSEKVEIQATFYYVQGNSGKNVFASISNHATYGSNSLHHDLQHGRAVTVGAERGGQGIITVSWYLLALGLEAIGASNTIYFAAKCDSTTGTPNIKWGGASSGEYQNFVMRAIALPA